MSSDLPPSSQMSSDSPHSPPAYHSPTQSHQPQLELRHVTSTSFRSPRRASQMLRTSDARHGSRSPGSIPSSPTSVHSSSSAIFERDIEPLVSPSPPNSSNPHRIPRAKTTEHLELSVPSVLDSAATILTGLQDPESGDKISVVTPANSSGLGDPYGGRSSGFASPIGSFRSRSPSPLGLRLGSGPFGHAGQRADLLLSIPQPNPHSMSAIATTTSGSPQSHPSGIPAGRPSVQTQFVSEPEQHDRLHVESTPSIITPTSTYFTTTSSVDDESDSPTATSHDDHQYETKRQQHQLAGTAGAATVAVATTTAPSTGATATSPLISPLSTTSPSHPPSPSHGANKRLSFMSYSDLLTSTPASTLPLSMLTTSASSIDPPPHLLSLTGHHYHHHGHQHPTTASATGSLRGFPISPNGAGSKHGGGPARQDSLNIFDDVGGEFEREGFGKGLEERLEASIVPVTAGSPTMTTQRA
ncbi:hypothetical protein F5887DRAFT_980272 [Amanita rubescens]|nr:hypothetical protein F5887DRAFT_980272 [Amanita rubescens]